jgi:hypothetical protein
MLQRENIVANLGRVRRVGEFFRLGLEQEKLIETGHGPFDSAGQYRLPTDKRPNE